VIPVEVPGVPDVIGGEASMNSEQITRMAEVKNRSTDPRFLPPEFIISAVSIGERGSFAMVDGRLLREGAVLRTGERNPRGWRLFRVTEEQLYWQPLE
jgi:hypothetical protein